MPNGSYLEVSSRGVRSSDLAHGGYREKSPYKAKTCFSAFTAIIWHLHVSVSGQKYAESPLGDTFTVTFANVSANEKWQLDLLTIGCGFNSLLCIIFEIIYDFVP